MRTEGRHLGRVDVSVETLLYPVHILGYTGVHTREPRDCTPTNKDEDDYRTGICYTWAEAEFLDGSKKS